MLGSVIHLEIPVDQVEEERDEGHEVDEDEADEDPLWDPDEIVHCAIQILHATTAGHN